MFANCVAQSNYFWSLGVKPYYYAFITRFCHIYTCRDKTRAAASSLQDFLIQIKTSSYFPCFWWEPLVFSCVCTQASKESLVPLKYSPLNIPWKNFFQPSTELLSHWSIGKRQPPEYATAICKKCRGTRGQVKASHDLLNSGKKVHIS